MIAARPAGTLLATAERPDPTEIPAIAPALAAGGVTAIVALLVGTTPIGSGDYGQWLMVARAFGGASTPEYRVLADVPPLVPTLIASIEGALGDPILALHLVGVLIVIGLGAAFAAAGTIVGGRAYVGLLAVVLGLLVTDRFLELLAFGGLLQAAAIVWLVLAVAAFSQAMRDPGSERRWWIAGCAALFACCLTHVPTAAVAFPVCLAAAGLAAIPGRGDSPAARLRMVRPLVVGFAAIGMYWLIVIAPASLGYVANPASLAYRGPERVIQLLAAYPPTLAIIGIGLVGLATWVARMVATRRLPARRDPRTVLLVWLCVSWAMYVVSALSGASTDYPRLVPLLIAPLVIAAAASLGDVAGWFARRWPARANGERGLVAVGLVVALVAPFSIANFQSEAQGYRLADDRALIAAAAWTDSRLVPGAAVLAPVREAKWFEGLTGRSALFSSQVRYAFRPIEWERSLAADALLRGNLTLANEAFILTMSDGAAASDGPQPRSLLIAMNHGGEFVDLLRLVPATNAIIDEDGATIATLPAMRPAGFERALDADRATATTRWWGARRGSAVAYRQSVSVERGAMSFDMDLRVDTDLAVGGLQVEFRPPAGVAVVDVRASGGTAEVTFARVGRTEPRIRLTVAGGTITETAERGLLVATTGRDLALRVTDLTPGGPSTSLALLDPPQIVADYDIGAVILRRDPAYDARRARLELLGFHVARAEGPYIVMVRSGAVVPAPP